VTQQNPEVEQDDAINEEDVSQWQFIEPRTPTASAIRDLLTTLPPVWGIRMVDFIDWVQPLPQTMTINKRTGNVVSKQKAQAYTLYTSVAGRQKMLNKAQEDHGWTVEFVPEERTPTGVPGIIQLEPAIIYRVYLRIHDKEGRLIGSRPGTAWIPASGRTNAALTNPIEKVETSANGRALGAWGFGVLPASGIATIEEMTGARENQAAMARQERRQYGPGGSVPGGPPIDRSNILQTCQEVIEELRKIRKQSTEESNRKTADYLDRALGVKNPWDDELKIVNWKNVNSGQLALLLPKLNEMLDKERTERNPL
jgi:hypothetical protein